MTLEEIVAQLDAIDNSLTICAAKSPNWTPQSQAELCLAIKAPQGCRFPYFLEVSAAKNVLAAWSYARHGRAPDLSSKCKAIIYYAEHDAYILPEND